MKELIRHMKRFPRMKCKACGHWNRVPANKIFLEQTNPIEPKVKAYVPMYEPLETVKCKKCGNIIAEPKELV
jgi:ribosomal protein S27E